MTNVDCILGRFDQLDARRLASLDLILQARTSTVTVIAVLALAHLKRLLQESQALPDGTGTRVGTEITPSRFLGAPVNAQPRKVAIR